LKKKLDSKRKDDKKEKEEGKKGYIEGEGNLARSL